MIDIGQFIDLTGKKFGRLTVLGRADSKIRANGKPRTMWKCLCECGNEIIVEASALRSGRRKSCGCIQSEYENLLGHKYGRLTVIRYYEKRKRQSSPGYKHYWLCKCDCGNEKVVEAYSLKTGRIRSCGCLNIERITKHNMRHTRLHEIWHGMKNRCKNSSCVGYKDYGGRGIKVCNEWQEFIPFAEWALNNGYSDNLTIDRIDVDGNYEPSNCRWATMKEQGNNRRNNRRVIYHGVSYTISELSDKTNVPYSKLSKIVNSDGDIETMIDKTAAKYYVHIDENDIADAVAVL